MIFDARNERCTVDVVCVSGGMAMRRKGTEGENLKGGTLFVHAMTMDECNRAPARREREGGGM